MNRSTDRPFIQQRIHALETIAEDNWNNAYVLFEVFSELKFRKPRKRPTELRDSIIERLLELAEAHFRWPSTTAVGGNSSIETAGWPRTGLLSYLGYHAGKTELTAAARRSMLNRAYQDDLPTMNNPIYMAQWGEPKSGTRLRKMAESLAAFCRNQKRKQEYTHSTAVMNWESDLAYLKVTYYDGTYDFRWPRT